MGNIVSTKLIARGLPNGWKLDESKGVKSIDAYKESILLSIEVLIDDSYQVKEGWIRGDLIDLGWIDRKSGEVLSGNEELAIKSYAFVRKNAK